MMQHVAPKPAGWMHCERTHTPGKQAGHRDAGTTTPAALPWLQLAQPQRAGGLPCAVALLPLAVA
eukprot:scaffold22661_cov18-Tisochrysis_lutea.AAC.1